MTGFNPYLKLKCNRVFKAVIVLLNILCIQYQLIYGFNNDFNNSTDF